MRVASFQTVADSANTPANKPYKRLPEIAVDAQTRKAKWGTRVGITGQYVNFVRDLPPEGQRLDLDPYVRFVNDHSAWYVASQLDLRHTRYLITHPDPGLPDDPARTLPQYSVEGGLRFERLTGGGDLQTLEPRLYYLYVPFRDQSSLPQFDSGEPDFTFVQLYERNRFSGADRLSDADHLALAVTSRLLDPEDGTQQLSASVGQIYRFQPTRVSLDGCLANCTTSRGGTDFIGELDYRLLSSLRFTTTGQWSQDRNEIIRGGAALHYRQDQRRADVSYRYREVLPLTGTSLEQVDVSAATPVFGPLSALGRWRFSRQDSRTLEALGGLEYQTCCWAFRGAVRRYQFGYDQAAASPLYTTGIYFQLELKGLTRIGASVQSLLPPLD